MPGEIAVQGIVIKRDGDDVVACVTFAPTVRVEVFRSKFVEGMNCEVTAFGLSEALAEYQRRLPSLREQQLHDEEVYGREPGRPR